MKKLLFIFFVLITTLLHSQLLDSLENRLQEVKGTEKLEVLHELVQQYANNDADKTKGYIDQILSIAKDRGNPEEIFDGLMEEGNYWYQRGNFKRTLEVYEQADSIVLVLSDLEKHAQVLYVKGRSTYFLSDYIQSNQFFIESARIQDSLGNTAKVVNAYNGLALIHMNQKKFEQAMEYINKAEEEGLKLKDFKLEAVLSTKGIIYKELGEFEKSIEYHNKTLALSKKKNNKHSIAKDYNNLAAVYGVMKNFKKAKEYYEKALALKREVKDNSGEAVTLVGYAMILLEEKNTVAAINMLEQSLEIADEIGNKDLTKYIFENLTDAYKRSGNFEKALQNQSMYMAVKDSIHNIDFQKKIAELNVAYQTEKKELEIKQQQEKILKNELIIKNNRLYGVVALLGFIILSSIVFAYFKRMQIKRAQLQEVISHRKELNKIATQNKLQEQRIRISRDLHDNIGSQLTFIISSVENLQFLAKDTDQLLKDKFRHIVKFSKDTIAQLRDTIWAMNHDKISFEDFENRMLSYLNKAKLSNENVKIKFNSEITTPLTLTSIKGVNLFRVVQEAINNALKHADTNEINISLKQRGEYIKLEISDNGTGFDITSVEAGNGLENMQKRINEIGGVFEIDSSKKTGTNIRITCNKNTLNVV